MDERIRKRAGLDGGQTTTWDKDGNVVGHFIDVGGEVVELDAEGNRVLFTEKTEKPKSAWDEFTEGWEFAK